MVVRCATQGERFNDDDDDGDDVDGVRFEFGDHSSAGHAGVKTHSKNQSTVREERERERLCPSSALGECNLRT